MKAPLRTLLLSLMLTAGLLACKPRTPEPPASEPVAMEDSTENSTEAKGCLAVSRTDAGKMDRVISLRPLVEDDCLHLKVSYGGGCRDHQFALLWDGSWMKSMPPQVNLRLSHDNGGDMCRSIKAEKLMYDLKPLRYEGTGQLVINVVAEGADPVRINYLYP